jgi:predicted ABC-type ATPase
VVLQQADSTSIFDNSTLFGYQKLLTLENEAVTEQASSVPEWIRTLLP